MSKLNITENQRRAISAPLTGAYSKAGDFIEVTEWSNGEGYDVAINDRLFSIHYTEWKVLKKIIKKFDKL
jgi:hypothetical protein